MNPAAEPAVSRTAAVPASLAPGLTLQLGRAFDGLRPGGNAGPAAFAPVFVLQQFAGLRIGDPGDSPEHEADRAADAMCSPGSPLEGPTLRSMEIRFGRDFWVVRVHTVNSAGPSARPFGALAYTVGQCIAFAPQGGAGQHLRAHELTQMLQQRQAGARPLRMRTDCDAVTWDGTQPGCGCGMPACWRLVDLATQEAMHFALDQIVLQRGLQRQFPGNWASPVQTERCTSQRWSVTVSSSRVMVVDNSAVVACLRMGQVPRSTHRQAGTGGFSRPGRGTR
jgi:hypothetical protein